MARRLDFATAPENYRHWRLRVEAPFAYLDLDVDEQGGWFDGYELKLNSYDIGVDIELADAVQRLRFEHPNVRAVLLGSAETGHILRWRQHPHARRGEPRAQGEFL